MTLYFRSLTNTVRGVDERDDFDIEHAPKLVKGKKKGKNQASEKQDGQIPENSDGQNVGGAILVKLEECKKNADGDKNLEDNRPLKKSKGKKK